MEEAPAAPWTLKLLARRVCTKSPSRVRVIDFGSLHYEHPTQRPMDRINAAKSVACVGRDSSKTPSEAAPPSARQRDRRARARAA